MPKERAGSRRDFPHSVDEASLNQNAATFIAGLVIAVAACWQLALVIIVLVPVIAINGWIQMKFMKGFDADLKVWL